MSKREDETDRIKRFAEHSVCSNFNISNATDEIKQSKKMEFIITDPSIRTSHKPREQISTYTSATTNKIIKPVGRIKRVTVNAATSTTRIWALFERANHEDFCFDFEDFVHDLSFQHAKDAARYADNVVSESECSSRCTGIRICEGSDIAVAKREQQADFVPEKATKVSDASMKTLLLCVAKKVVAPCAQESVTTTDETEEETYESAKSLVSSIILAKWDVTTATDATKDVTRRELDDYAYWDATDRTFDNAETQVTSSIEEIRRDEDTVSNVVPCTEERSCAAITGEREEEARREARKESVSQVYPRSTVDRGVSIVSKTVDAAVGSSIIKPVRGPTKGIPGSLPCRSKSALTNGICPVRAEIVSLIDDIIDSFVETLPCEKTTAADVCQVSVSARSRKCFETLSCQDASALSLSCDVAGTVDECSTFNGGRSTRSKRTRAANGIERASAQVLFSFSPNGVKRSSDRLERPAVRIDHCDRSRSASKVCQPIRCRANLIPDNVHFKDCRYCGSSHLDSRNVSTRNVTPSQVGCCFSQDLCAGKRSSLPPRSAIVGNAVCRNYAVGNCAKRKATTFGNSLCSNTYYGGTKYCYSYLNDIDSARMGGHCHCNDDSPVWNDYRHYGRNQSYYWTDRNLYFM